MRIPRASASKLSRCAASWIAAVCTSATGTASSGADTRHSAWNRAAKSSSANSSSVDSLTAAGGLSPSRTTDGQSAISSARIPGNSPRRVPSIVVSGASLKSARNGTRCTRPRNAASAGKTGCSFVVENSFHVGLICRAFSLIAAALTVSPPLKTFSSGKSRLSVLASGRTPTAHTPVLKASACLHRLQICSPPVHEDAASPPSCPRMPWMTRMNEPLPFLPEP